jgi:hypothetical protein
MNTIEHARADLVNRAFDTAYVRAVFHELGAYTNVSAAAEGDPRHGRVRSHLLLDGRSSREARRRADRRQSHCEP